MRYARDARGFLRKREGGTLMWPREMIGITCNSCGHQEEWPVARMRGIPDTCSKDGAPVLVRRALMERPRYPGAPTMFHNLSSERKDPT